jgi:Undecaprenyl-phosphate galactose phosphotransferase WbaP
LATQQANEASEPKVSLAHARVPHSRPHLVSTNDHPVRIELEKDERAVSHDGTLVGLRPPVLSAFDSHASLLASVPIETSVNAALKRSLDILGALALGIVFSPLMLLILFFMRREGGPVIYRHRRVGRNGKVFECLKFRTMVPNAEQVLREVLERHPELKAEWLRDHKLRNDPRVTTLGRFLRRTSLDELPQLWNVVRGEMSLVGPRPVVREELMRYGRNLRVYLSAKPGITGLWQVMGRNDTDYRRRVAMDVCYVRNQNLLLDLYILLKTTRVVLGGGGAY